MLPVLASTGSLPTPNLNPSYKDKAKLASNPAYKSLPTPSLNLSYKPAKSIVVRKKDIRTLESINSYFSELEQMLQSISLSHLEAVLQLLEVAYHNGHRIFIMGNGGSAATASHFA